MTPWARMVDVVPPGKQGIAEVRHVVVSERQAMFAAMRGERLAAGPLAQLFVEGGLMMSDGSNEKGTNWQAVREAHGDVLVVGLGIGMVLVPILRKAEVRSVTVVEKFADVVALVEPHIRRHVEEAAGKLEVVVGDAFSWVPSRSAQRWQCIYLDIWPVICTDNLPEIARLKRGFRRWLDKADPGAWIGAWMEDQLRAHRRREQRAERDGYSYRWRL